MKIESVKGTNFRTWHNVDLSLVGIMAAAILGPNGSGKSCLVELILWALYGKSRESLASSVIRQGATDVSAEVVFSARGQRFRVVRTRNLKGKAEVTLFREATGDAEGNLFAGATQWAPAGGRGMRETEEAIALAAGVDYDTLTNCSVLLQDEHGKFSKAQPAERMALLRNLLRLERWEARAKEARARAKSLTDVARAAERRMVPGAELALARLKSDLETAKGSVTLAEVNVEKARAQITVAIEAVAGARAELTTAERQAAEADTYRARATDLRGKAAVSRAEAAQVLAQQKLVEDALAALAGLPAAREAVTAAEAVVNKARGRVSARAEQSATLRGMASEREGLRGQIAALPTDAKLAEVQLAAAGVEEADAAAQAAQDTLEAIKDRGIALKHARSAAELDAEPFQLNPPATRLATLEANLRAARAELRTNQATAGILDKVPCTAAPSWSGEDAEAPCDLAGTCPLLANARQATEQVETVTARIADIEAKITEARAQVDLAKEAIAKALDAQRAHDAAQGEYRGQVELLRTLAAEAAEFDEARQSLSQVAERVEERRGLEAKLAKAAEKAKALQESLADPGELAQTEGEAVRALDVARAALSTAEAQAARLDLLREALTRAEAAGARAAEIDKEADDLQALADGAGEGPGAARAEVERRAQAQAAAETDVTAAETEAKRAREAQLAAEREASKAEAVVDANTKAQAEVTENDAEAVAWTRAAKSFALAPKLLLEEVAIPAVEAEANRWLALFGRGMTLRLETQVEQQTTDHKGETLVVVVSDEHGSRGYASFSGGERVRIDIALRLGLARLLAEREGVPIEFLVIDEGDFGALDDEGIEAVTECLAVLQGRFKPLLVVTHIERIAEAMPRRITVSRTPYGPELMVA